MQKIVINQGRNWKKMPLCSFALSNLWKENKFKEVIWMFVVIINKKKHKTKKLEKNILQD